MNKIQAHFSGKTISSNSSDAFALCSKSHIGESIGEKVLYSFTEALYLLDTGRTDVWQKNKKFSFRSLMDKIRKIDKKIDIKYTVFKDLRQKGYVVKTALKFGAEFRVYDKGKTPNQVHAKWIVFTGSESEKLTWHEFAAKNRVAHSTKKNLLLAIVDDENDIIYYEVKWVRP
ncbi:MAG: tRNA-intron lyase [Candidatus Pacearchaeota archaeon]